MRYIGCGDFYVDSNHFLLQLNQLKKYSKVVGIRQIMSYHTESTYSPCQYHHLPKNLTQKLTLLKGHHYIFECQMYASQLLNILDNISDSQVTTVIEHMALPALLRKIIVNFRKVIFLCSLLRIKQLIQIIYQ